IRCRQERRLPATRSQVKRAVLELRLGRSECHRQLAEYLCVRMQRVARRAPGLIRQRRPPRSHPCILAIRGRLASAPSGHRHGMAETQKEKTDRQLLELLNELRVALPGAQVLLAFLLTAPFQARFARTTGYEHWILYAGVLLTAVGVVLLMAPSV